LARKTSGGLQNLGGGTRIVIGLSMTTSPSNESNPFAVKFISEKGKASYLLAHQNSIREKKVLLKSWG
jgi:hypothetical protein